MRNQQAHNFKCQARMSLLGHKALEKWVILATRLLCTVANARSQKIILEEKLKYFAPAICQEKERWQGVYNARSGTKGVRR